MERTEVQTGCAKQPHSELLCPVSQSAKSVVARPATLHSFGRGRQSSNLVKKGKPVWHSPVFDEFSICKSTDVHDINGHGFARARIGAGCLAARPNRIAGFHDGLYRELQVFDAVPRILDLRLQYLRAGDIGF